MGEIVELDQEGHLVRAASAADPARPNDLLMAYSLLPMPDIDRVVVTNSSMRYEDMVGHTYQVFRLSDLKLLSTNDLDSAPGRYGEINPEEARRGPDGSGYVQTTGCGIERITEIASSHPRSKLVYQFPGSFCGVPSIVSHYLIQSVRLTHAVVVLDLTKPDHPVEVSCVVLDGVIAPHWTGYDAKTHRVAVTGYGENRLFMLNFDPATVAIAMDKAFHDPDGHPASTSRTAPGPTAGAARRWPTAWCSHARPVRGQLIGRLPLLMMRIQSGWTADAVHFGECALSG